MGICGTEVIILERWEISLKRQWIFLLEAALPSRVRLHFKGPLQRSDSGLLQAQRNNEGVRCYPCKMRSAGQKGLCTYENLF